MGCPPLGGGRLSFLSLSPMNQCTHGLWSRLGTPRVPLVHLVLQACSGRFPCKCGPRPLRAGRRRGPAPPTATPLGFQPCGRSSWVFRPWQYLVTKYPLSVAQENHQRESFFVFWRRVFVFVFLLLAPLGGRLSFLSLSPMNQCTRGLWSRLGTPCVPLVHL